jgi:chemotaxis protein MotB
MGRRNQQQEEDSGPGAPEWMVTFSDCMTLLLTFFVLLLSFSSFDNKVFKKLRVIYSTALSSIVPIKQSDRDALQYLAPIKYTSEYDQGSEKPTQSEGESEGLLKEQQSSDLDNGMVFLLPSKNIFWGKGVQISTEGRNVLDEMAPFLAEMPNRIVISEKTSVNNQEEEYAGLQRAWAVVDYLSSKYNIDKNRLSVSIQGTVYDKKTENQDSSSPQDENTREVEISLLQRSIYN